MQKRTVLHTEKMFNTQGRGGKGGGKGARDRPFSAPQQQFQHPFQQPNFYPQAQPQQGGYQGGGKGLKATSKEMKKEGRRQKQAQAIEKKAGQETDLFRYAQAEAIRRNQSGEFATTGRAADMREQQLFKAQGARGINFDTYDAIEVKVSGPGCDSVLPLEQFAALGDQLPQFLSRNIGLMKYDKPTPIQKYAIPLGLAGFDLMCCAQTGSGKTCAFLMPIVSHMFNNKPQTLKPLQWGAAKPGCVVLAPTRELASQISVEAEKLCNRSGLMAVVVYGGANQAKQVCRYCTAMSVFVLVSGDSVVVGSVVVLICVNVICLKNHVDTLCAEVV